MQGNTGDQASGSGAAATADQRRKTSQEPIASFYSRSGVSLPAYRTGIRQPSAPPLKDGKTVETGLVGNEGVAGMPAILGLKGSPLREAVQIPGTASG